MAEEFDFHLLKLTRSECEIARRDFVSKALANLGNAKRNSHTSAIEHILKVHKDPLGCFWLRRPPLFAAERADVGLEHEIELTGIGEGVELIGVGCQHAGSVRSR